MRDGLADQNLLCSITEQIVASGGRDVRHIEQTLDGLLNFCGHDAILPLYRRLCRYYFGIDRTAAASYVHAYCEMYDSDDAMEAGG